MTMISDDVPRPLTFAFASCLYPAGLLDARMARRALHRLAALRGPGGPEFLLLVGDQIYVDATGGMFDTPLQPHAREALYANADASGMDALAGGGIGLLTMLDDHEIVDNWEPLPAARRGAADNAALLQQSCVAYAANRRTRAPGALSASQPGPLWYTHAADGHRWFVADTRTERALRNARVIDKASILGETQWNALDAWLRASPAGGVSFVASPAIVLPRRLSVARDPAAALFADAWDGYPASLHRLLALLWRCGRARIVLLSGDEHIPCAATITLSKAGDDRTVVVHSLHAPALYAPYPFANGSADYLAGDETFEFDYGAERYRCTVTTAFPPAGDGFAVVRVDPEAGTTVEFHRAKGGVVRLAL